MSKVRGRVQLRDVAARVGISPSGASLALRDHPSISEATRQRAQRAARELGYAAIRRKSATVRQFGFVYCDPSAATFDSNGFEPALRLLMRDPMATNARFELLMVDDDPALPATRHKLEGFARNLEGLLLFGEIHAPMIELLNQLRRPSVVMGETDISDDQEQQLKLQRVTDNPVRAGRIATSYLLRRGRRRIAFVGGIRTPGFYYDQWYEGFLLAHAKAGVTVLSQRVMWHEVGNSDGGTPLGQRIASLAQGDARPDAIVWPDAGIASLNRPTLRDHGLELPAEDEVIGGMSHWSYLRGQEHYPQVLSDLGAMTEEAIRRLQAICRHGAGRATSITVPNVVRNMNT